MEINSEEVRVGTGKQTKKRGRRRKDEVVVSFQEKDRSKYYVDVSKEDEQNELIKSYLKQANQKTYGREIILKDLVLLLLPRLTTKDIEKLQEQSLSEMEKVSRALDEHNRKSEKKLTLGEFLVKRLALQ
jgi:hypothetical protein